MFNVRIGGGGSLNKAMFAVGASSMLGLVWLKYNEDPEVAAAERAKERKRLEEKGGWR